MAMAGDALVSVLGRRLRPRQAAKLRESRRRSTEKAPDMFKVEVRHEQGRLRRRSAPRLGAARRRSLLQPREERLLRRRPVLPRDSETSWRSSASTAMPAVRRRLGATANIKDDPVKQSNKRGYVTFANAGRRTRERRRCSSTSRTTRSSTARASRRSARSSTGMDVVDKLYTRIRPDEARTRVASRSKATRT